MFCHDHMMNFEHAYLMGYFGFALSIEYSVDWLIMAISTKKAYDVKLFQK